MKRFLTIIILCFGLQMPTVAQSTSDHEVVVQKALDFEEIQQYYHPEIEGRLPIIIIDNKVIPDSLRLIKFEQEVEFWDKGVLFQLGRKFCIEFKEFEIDHKSAKTTFLIWGEGVQVDLTLEKEKGNWIITQNRVIEK